MNLPQRPNILETIEKFYGRALIACVVPLGLSAQRLTGSQKMTEQTAKALISAMGLKLHPEGGWYRETWRGAPDDSGRASGTVILYLLESGQRSHWHAVDATEIWFWHAGAPLQLSTAQSDTGPVTDVVLGGDLLEGGYVQGIIPAHHWQAAESLGDWTLVSCTVTPGFEFEGFVLAPPEWRPG
jgi:predicted cupin superfamily sugar epimerase